MTQMHSMTANSATTLIVLLVSHLAANAHDPNRPELNHWFESLKSGKGPCCSNADGIAVASPDWESRGGGYRVRLYGQWWDVPPEAVIVGPNLTGRTIAWPVYEYIDGMPARVTDIRCFIPGRMM